MKERSNSIVLHRTVIGWLGTMALVLAIPSSGVALPTPLEDSVVPFAEIEVPLPAALRFPMPAPAWR